MTETAWLGEALAITPRAERFTVRGAAINFLGWNLDAVDRPGLLFVHGMTASAQWWAPVAPFFLPDFRVVAIDLSGMGDSDHRPRYDRATHAEEIAAAIATFGLRDATIIAHSFGGIPASEAVRLQPDLASRLVLVDSPVVEMGSPLRDERWNGPRKPHASRDIALARYKLIPPGQHPMAAYVRHIAEHALIEREDGWHWKFDWRLSARYDVEEPVDVGAIAIPTWVVFGDLSEIQGKADALALGAMLRRPAGVVGIPNAHHHVMIEQPLAFVAAMRTILSNDS